MRTKGLYSVLNCVRRNTKQTNDTSNNNSSDVRAGEMDFNVGGAMEHWKVMLATMVGRQEKFSNSRRSRMSKIVIFWPWWQPFNSFCFETLSFLLLSPFFLFATQKSGEREGGRGEHGPRCRWSRRHCSTE